MDSRNSRLRTDYTCDQRTCFCMCSCRTLCRTPEILIRPRCIRNLRNNAILILLVINHHESSSSLSPYPTKWVGTTCFPLPFSSITRHFHLHSFYSHVILHTVRSSFLRATSAKVPIHIHTHHAFHYVTRLLHVYLTCNREEIWLNYFCIAFRNYYQSSV
jgi:hypothetical protein